MRNGTSLAFLLLCCGAAAQQPLSLGNEHVRCRIDPSTLAIEITPADQPGWTVAPVPGLGAPDALEADDARASFSLPARGLAVTAQLVEHRLIVSLRSDREQELAWPTLPCASPGHCTW